MLLGAGLPSRYVRAAYGSPRLFGTTSIIFYGILLTLSQRRGNAGGPFNQTRTKRVLVSWTATSLSSQENFKIYRRKRSAQMVQPLKYHPRSFHVLKIYLESAHVCNASTPPSSSLAHHTSSLMPHHDPGGPLTGSAQLFERLVMLNMRGTYGWERIRTYPRYVAAQIEI